MTTEILFKQLPPLSLYIHIPWCIKKCPYCDFNSHVADSVNQEKYIDCLIQDLEMSLPLIWGRSLQSIFIGGGTPSLFDGEMIDRLLKAVRSRVRLSPFAEITMEANPGAIDNNNLRYYSEVGVNRLSIGIQSFNNHHLKILGRVHDRDLAIAAVLNAKKYFKSVNIDLMYGLPKQNLSELIEDIELATSFDVNHISYYNLTLEPNTLFYSKEPDGMPDNDLCYEMQEIIVEHLASSGYNRYETSAYARDGFQCSHNLNYWRFGDYLGIGAGAHSKLSFHNKITRIMRQKHPESYMSGVNNQTHITVNNEILVSDLAGEFMMNALRLVDGFEASLFIERTSLSLSDVLETLQKCVNKGFIKPLVDRMIIPTKRGQDFLNDLLLEFL